MVGPTPLLDTRCDAHATLAPMTDRWGEDMRSPTLAELEAMSREELVEKHDYAATHARRNQRFLNGIFRRDEADRSKILVRLTWAITALALVNVVLVAVAILIGD